MPDRGHLQVVNTATHANGAAARWDTRTLFDDLIHSRRGEHGDGRTHELRSSVVDELVAAVLGAPDQDALDGVLARLGAVGDEMPDVLSFLFAVRDAVVTRADQDGGSPTRRSIDRIVDDAVDTVVAARLEVLRDQALTDGLTGLGNRRALDRDLRIELARVERTGRPLTVVILDLDGLKAINDRNGHEAGDDALRSMASALDELVRESDRAYRFGGDEFALLLSDAVIADPDAIIERLRRSGAPACSVGISCSAIDPPDALVAVADQRMYAQRERVRSSRYDLGAAGVHRVLLVDDAPEIRGLLRMRLEMFDNVEIVGEAGTGADGAALTARLTPDLVIMDLEMPVMNGDEAIACIRTTGSSAVLVLYTSAPELAPGPMDPGAADALIDKAKPLEELVDCLHLLLSRHEQSTSTLDGR